jgi:transglutaminase-like putative cysteine protease
MSPDGGRREAAVFRIRHTTEYAYSEPVAASLHHAVLVPRETTTQRVLESSLRVAPEPRSLQTAPDYFGNNLTRFSIEAAAASLRVDAESAVLVDTAPAGALPDSPPLGEWARSVSARRDPGTLGAMEFMFDSPHVSRSRALGDYAAGLFSSGQGVIQAVVDLMHAIHRDFVYDPAVTEVSTPVGEVLERREGVCQDFAHLMIGCLRTLGLPARYVSGYLAPLPGVVGAQASHAWVSVFLPDAGWIDFDPTNDIIPAGGHITVGWGRDYADVSPLCGVMLGGGEHTLHVEVSVEASA